MILVEPPAGNNTLLIDVNGRARTLVQINQERGLSLPYNEPVKSTG